MTLLEMPDVEGAETLDRDSHVGQWRLARVEVLNWGTFDGLHTIEVARRGHLFTGASGSGKSSLLDAIATVLTPDRWLRFNAAAQDTTARGDDRSIVSYVRGAWSKEADESLDRAVSTYLRTGATWSGILLRYENGADAPVTLVRVFHLRGSSVDKADLRDACIVDRGELGLLGLREFVEAGIEARRLKAALPDAVITTNGSHAPFYAKLRRLLQIDNQHALHLLHKTQSAKNLGSLDQLFRTFMLDEPTTFKRAETAVEQFGELSEAHRHVVDLRRQAEHLRTVEAAIVDYEDAAALAAEAARLGELIDPFQARLTRRLADDERAGLRAEHARVDDAARTADARRVDAKDALQVAERRTMQLGGSDAVELKHRLRQAEADAAATAVRFAGFAESLASVDVSPAPTDVGEFAELQESARRQLAEAQPAAQHDHDDNTAYFEAKRELETIDRELTELRMRRSNLPAALQVERRRLAEGLGVAESALPFAGELIEVQPEFAEWTGAIERVLHPLAVALLVRDEYLGRVRAAIEGRHLGARLVIEAVPAVPDRPRAARSDRSLLHRVRVVDGPFSEWLAARLAAEFDVACVDHPDELDTVDRGVTINGQMKKSARRYEKDDRYRIDDRSRWILGADNEAKLDLLLERRRDAERRHEAARDRLDRVQAEIVAATKRRTVFEAVLRQEWADIDRAAADERVRSCRRLLDEATVGNTEYRDAVEVEQAARAQFDEADGQARAAAVALDGTARELAEVDRLIAELDARVTPDLTDADAAVLERRYRGVQRTINRRSVGDVGRRVADALHREHSAATERANRAQNRFVESAAVFRGRWPAASADLTTEIADRAGYRALLEGIVARGLPEHEGNFLKLLREKSRDLIGHLLDDIRSAPRQVEERIEPVNASLGRSRFDADRYLFIEVKTRRAPEVVQFMADLKTVVDGAWSDESLESAERRFAVLNQVMTRLASSESADRAWQRRCLDTREHVTFMAHERDLGGRSVNVHDSSAGLSGGQRQKLVVFCLAAALRYQLTADEDDLPSYATIVLDEAFDKADSRYTRMAMDVFVEFGFHMILATPEKLLQTIEPYVGAVTSITNASRKNSQVATVWFDDDEGAPV